MKSTHRIFAAAFAIAVASPAVSLAQNQSAPADSAMEFSEQQLEAFAAAAVELDELRREWNPKLEAADNGDQAAEIQRRANMEMAQAVQESGITVDTYNRVAMALQSDEELGAKVQGYIEEVR